MTDRVPVEVTSERLDVDKRTLNNWRSVAERA